jgi:hypothetical protein
MLDNATGTKNLLNTLYGYRIRRADTCQKVSLRSPAGEIFREHSLPATKGTSLLYLDRHRFAACTLKKVKV